MNKSNSILLIDPSFDPAMATSCELLIKVGMDSFSYAIINKKSNKISALFDEQECGDAEKRLIERVKTDNYLQLPFKQVKVALHTPNFLAIPNVVFDTQNISAYASYFTTPHTQELYATVQPFFGFTTIFAFPKRIVETLSALKSKNFQEHAGLLHLSQHGSEEVLWLDFSAGSVSIIYVRAALLIFQQTFEISHTEELNYYLLLWIDQLEIKVQQTEVRLTGIIHEEDPNYACLSKYFNHLEFVAAQTDLDQGILDDLPAHYYSNLLALDQCVS